MKVLGFLRFSCFFHALFLFITRPYFLAPKEYLKEAPSMKIYSGADLCPSEEKSTINVSSKLNPGHHFVYTLYVSMIVPCIKCTLIKKTTFSLFIFTAREDAFYKHLITLILWPRCFDISLSEVLGIFSETSK